MNRMLVGVACRNSFAADVAAALPCGGRGNRAFRILTRMLPALARNVEGQSRRIILSDLR